MTRAAPTVALATACALAACSLIVKPAEAPRFCEGPGADCGEGYTCLPASGGAARCVRVCVDDAGCLADSPERPYCGADGLCIECREGAHCTRPGYPVCAAGLCVPGCLTDEQCGGEQPRCSPDGRCVECVESSHCDLGSSCAGLTCVPGCDGPERCPEGAYCVDRVCRTPEPEICDERDNDLDGEVDEDFDRDGDGYSTCAGAPPSGDCNDDPDRDGALQNPGRPEICNGIDDDCDGLVDEETCTGGEVCDPRAGRCVPRECDGDGDCYDGRICVTEVGQCEHRAGYGDLCLGESQCSEGSCIRVATLGAGDARCTELCCSEFDCPAAHFCVDDGSGLKVCAPESWFGTLGVSCGSRRDCPACASSTCLRQCCRDADCGANGCQLVELTTPMGSGVVTQVCDYRTRGLNRYQTSDCGAPGSFYSFCNSQLAYEIIPLILPFAGTCICTAPCCRDADCADSARPEAQCILAANGRAVCYPTNLSGTTLLGDWEFEPLTGAGFGDRCTESDECASAACHPGRYCTEPCCSDADCPGSHGCRIQETGAGIFARLCTRL